MNGQLILQNLLRRHLFDIRKRRPEFSVRAFALKLGLQASATNEILKGERAVSRKLAERIADRLLLNPTERYELLKHFLEKPKAKPNRERQRDDVDPSYLKLTADQFQIISEWVHFAILSLINTHDFNSDPGWIAGRLGVTEKKVITALERLERLELIERTPDGRIKRTKARLHTEDDVLNLSIQRAHIEDMEIAKESLSRDPIILRDFTSITMAVSPSLIPKAKEIIRRAREEIAKLLPGEKPSEVYRLSVYLYPLTTLRNQEKENEKH